MKEVKLVIDGEVFKVELDDELISALTETKKKTGYERVRYNDKFCYINAIDGVEMQREVKEDHTALRYENANYYSDIIIAQNNARADKLYRQLRRFAVEHRKEKLDWNNKNIYKYYLLYNHNNKKIDISVWSQCQDYGSIYFDSEETAQLAIDTFKDELIWYFTEYKDSL